MIHHPSKIGQPTPLESRVRVLVRFGAAWVPAYRDVHRDRHLDLPVLDDSTPRPTSATPYRGQRCPNTVSPPARRGNGNIA